MRSLLRCTSFAVAEEELLLLWRAVAISPSVAFAREGLKIAYSYRKIMNIATPPTIAERFAKWEPRVLSHYVSSDNLT